MEYIILAIVITSAFNLVLLRIIRFQSVDSLFGISLAVALTLWYTFPLMIAVAIPSVLDIGWAGRRHPDAFFQSYLLEAFFILILIVIFFLYLVRKTRLSIPLSLKAKKVPSANVSIAIFTISVLLILYSMLQMSGDYLTANASAAIYDGLDQSTLDKYLIFASSLSMAALTCLYIDLEEPKWLGIASFGIITTNSILIAMQGGRIWLVLPIFIIFARAFSSSERGIRPSSKGYIYFRVTLVFLLLIALLPLLPLLSEYRSTSQQVRISEIASGYNVDSSIIFDELFTKLDGFSTSSALLEYEGPGKAGLAPYIGSLLIFIPRTIWNDRPVAGSVDGTYLGHPSRLIPRLVGINSEAYNVGYAPVHATVWHWGWIGGVVFVAAGFIWLVTLNNLLSNAEFWPRFLGIYMLILPSFSGVIMTPDNILKSLILVSILLYGGRLALRFLQPKRSKR